MTLSYTDDDLLGGPITGIPAAVVSWTDPTAIIFFRM